MAQVQVSIAANLAEKTEYRLSIIYIMEFGANHDCMLNTDK